MTSSDIAAASARHSPSFVGQDELLAFVAGQYEQAHFYCSAPPAAADERAVVLDFSGLTAIKEYVKSDLVVSCESGLKVSDLNARLAEHGQWLPVAGADEMRLIDLVLGADGGYLESGYGPVRSQILGLEAVWGPGQILKCGGKVVKNVTGFDLSKLIVASRGHFCFPLALSLKLHALPKVTACYCLESSCLDLLNRASAVLASALPVMALEIVEQDGKYLLVVQVGGPETLVAEVGGQLKVLLGSGLEEMDGNEALALLQMPAYPHQHLLELSGSRALMEALLQKLTEPSQGKVPGRFGQLRLRPAAGRLYFMGSSAQEDSFNLVHLAELLLSLKIPGPLAEYEALALTLHAGVRSESYRLGASQPALGELYARIKAKFDPLGAYSPLVRFDFSGKIGAARG